MTTSVHPTSWFSPMHLDGDGWWGPLCLAQNSANPSVDGVSAATSPFCTRPNSVNSIDNTLHKLVDDPASGPFVFWAADGLSFMVQSVREFSTSVLPRYFNNTSFCKFIVELSTNGFSYRLADSNLIEFAKEGFVRGLSHPLQKGFGIILNDEPSTDTKAGYFRGQTHPLQKVLTSIPVQSPMPGPFSGELEVKEETNGGSSILRLLDIKTYVMVDDPATNHIVSWDPTGRSFVVWNLCEFCRDLLHKYFEHQDFYKFILLLCVNGFRFRATMDHSQFEFAKEGFVRGERPLLQVVCGPKAKQNPQLTPYPERMILEDNIMEDTVETGQEKAEVEERIKEVFLQVLIQALSEDVERRHSNLELGKVMGDLEGQVEVMPTQSPLQDLFLRELETEEHLMGELVEDFLDIKEYYMKINLKLEKLEEELTRKDSIIEDIVVSSQFQIFLQKVDAQKAVARLQQGLYSEEGKLEDSIKDNAIEIGQEMVELAEKIKEVFPSAGELERGDAIWLIRKEMQELKEQVKEMLMQSPLLDPSLGELDMEDHLMEDLMDDARVIREYIRKISLKMKTLEEDLERRDNIMVDISEVLWKLNQRMEAANPEIL